MKPQRCFSLFLGWISCRFDMKWYFFVASRPRTMQFSRFSLLTAQMWNRCLHEFFPLLRLPIKSPRKWERLDPQLPSLFIWTIVGLKTLKVPKNHQRTDRQDVSNWRAGKHKPRIKTQVVAHGTTLAGAPGFPLITHPDGQSKDKRQSPDSSGVDSADIFTKNSFSVASPQQRHIGAPLPRVPYGTILSKAGDQRRRVRHVTTVTLHERGGGCFFKAERQRLHLMNYLQQRGLTWC